MIVNIARSRRRTTDPPTEHPARLGRAPGRDRGLDRDRPPGGLRAGRPLVESPRARGVRHPGRGGGEAPAAGPRTGCGRSTTCSCSCRWRPGWRSPVPGGPGRGPDRARGVHRRPGDQRQPGCGRGASTAPAVPRRVRRVLLRRDRHTASTRGAGRRPPLALLLVALVVVAKSAWRGGWSGSPGCRAARSRSRSASGRSASSASSWRGRRSPRDRLGRVRGGAGGRRRDDRRLDRPRPARRQGAVAPAAVAARTGRPSR